MRIVGLDAPTSGEVRVGDRRYRDLAEPPTEVGALLEARPLHPGRSAADHLPPLAWTHGIPRSRVDDVLELVGPRAVAQRRAGIFSLGIDPWLGIATPLLGGPVTLVLDELVDRLDPEGTHWICRLLRSLPVSRACPSVRQLDQTALNESRFESVRRTDDRVATASMSSRR
jgi:ABC-2 type transport system ATP-binding protein